LEFVDDVGGDAEEAEGAGGGAEVGWVADEAVGGGDVDVGDCADLVVDGAVAAAGAVADGAVGAADGYSGVRS